MANGIVSTKHQQLIHEWQILHRDHEKYEQWALLIKLFSIAVVLMCVAFSVNLLLSIIFIATLWLQEGIWKTFQARTARRLLALEMAINEGSALVKPVNHCEMYSIWQTQKPGTMTLVKEYIFNALRPTVMFPYSVLLVISLLSLL